MNNLLLQLNEYIKNRDFQNARLSCLNLLNLNPNDTNLIDYLQIIEREIHKQTAALRFPGPDYLHWLNWFHRRLNPRTYVEIGVETGASLANANSNCLSVGIDPDFSIVYTIQSMCKLFKEQSDDFFNKRDLKTILNDKPIDLAFIDGLHTFDQVLRDFINIERYSHRDTIVLFHDVYPTTPITASRDRKSLMWLGDTWKFIPLVKELRPDLKIFTIPTYSSGLAVITNCNPLSTQLIDSYIHAIDKWSIVNIEHVVNKLDEYTSLIPENNESCILSHLSIDSVS